MPENSSPDGRPDLGWLIKHTDDPADRARLYDLLATQLRRIAASLAKSQVGHTMQPTALVNEAWIKLFGGQPRSWEDQAHFLRSVTVTMRHILVDHCKRKRTQKRDDTRTEYFDEVVQSFERRGQDLVALDEALDALALEHPQMAHYVNLRFFGGRTNDEAARVLSISGRSGARLWSFARVWLQQRMAQ